MSAVRLWHIALLGDEGWCARRPGDNWLAETTAYIAIPAAEYAALVALLGEVRPYVGLRLEGQWATEATKREDGDLIARLDAALAGLGAKPA